MSSFSLNALKDRLYCSRADDPARRSGQAALFMVGRGLLSLIAPALPFTAEEAWGDLPAVTGTPERVFLTDMPEPRDLPGGDEIAARWERILAVRAEIAQPLEAARKEKRIGRGPDPPGTGAPGP